MHNLFRKKRPRLGMTFIELMVALTIVSIILGLSISTFRKQHAKTRLNNTSNEVLNLLLYAQNNASLKQTITQLCLIDSDDGNGARAIIVGYPGINRVADIPLGVDPTGAGTYRTIKNYTFESGITFCQDGGSRTGYCSEFTKWRTKKHCIPFNKNGYIQAYDPTVPEQYLWTSVCIISRDIEKQNISAREIEITNGGLINLVPNKETGDNNTADTDGWSPVMTAGVGSCSNKNL